MSVTRDEFETVKDLLASAARYAESANRGVDRLQLNQERLQFLVEQLLQTQQRTETRMEELATQARRTEERLEALATQSQKTETRLEELANQGKKTEARLDAFVAESQRLFSKQAEVSQRMEAISDRLEVILSYLVRGKERGEREE